MFPPFATMRIVLNSLPKKAARTAGEQGRKLWPPGGALHPLPSRSVVKDLGSCRWIKLFPPLGQPPYSTDGPTLSAPGAHLGHINCLPGSFHGSFSSAMEKGAEVKGTQSQPTWIQREK